MVPSHAGQSTVEGATFLAAAWVQLGLAAALVVAPRRWMLSALIIANLAFIGAWIVSRTAGLPYGSHVGHPESVGFVDLSCVGFEVAVVVVAALALARPGVGRTLKGVGALGIPLIVLALTSAAVASPAARDHAAGSHGDHAAAGGHEHGDEMAAADGHEHAAAAGEDGHAHEATGDDKGLSLLQNGHQHESGVEEIDAQTAATLAEQLALTASLVKQFPTLADAEAQGWKRQGPFAPGLGVHYSRDYSLNADGIMDPEDIAAPFLIYDGLGPTSKLAGFMYYMIGVEGEPEGFAGPNDHWHYHTSVCVAFQPDGTVDTPFGADLEGVTDAMCAEQGGRMIDYTGYMVHVWTVPGYESDVGVFHELNSKITCPQGDYYTIPTEEIGDRDTVCKNL
jgi:hypothetical protein